MKWHIKSVHEKIRDITCGLCDFTCSQSKNLKEHIKAVHDKVKEWSVNKYDYESHRNNPSKQGKTNQNNATVRRYHGNIELKNEGKCQLCEYVGKDETELTEHLMSLHVLTN